MNNDLVPFGKYKGKPVAMLANDAQYCEWLTSQDWFRDRYAPIYNVVINNFCEPTDTPEHNRLQALFLDEDFNRSFATDYVRYFGLRDFECFKDCQPHFKCNIFSCNNFSWSNAPECKECPQNNLKQKLEICEKCIWNCKNFDEDKLGDETLKVSDLRSPVFEEKGWDVRLMFYCCDFCPNQHNFVGYELDIELKPQIGDDYPSVIRQIKARDSSEPILIYQEFRGSGVTEEEMKRFFRYSEIRIIKLVKGDDGAWKLEW